MSTNHVLFFIFLVRIKKTWDKIHKIVFYDKLPPQREKIETLKILRETIQTTAALAELKGIANTIPNQSILLNAIVLQEAKSSSEIENIKNNAGRTS